MLGFVKNWLRPRATPIGVDFGSDSLRLAQVCLVDKEWRLTAAASADVPSHVRHDPSARMNFFIQTTRDLLASGGFVGRQAVLAMPVASMFIQHLRLPKMDDEALKKAIPWEARGKLPIDPSHALIRHHVAGEIYQDQEAKNEVIVMAAGRELVNQFLQTAARAKLDVVGMNVEPKALVDCFTHVYRRKTDADVTNMFVDLGCSGTRAIVSRGGHMLFARAIPVGGDHFTRAVAHSLGINQDEAKILRMKLCAEAAAAAAAEPARAPAASAAGTCESFAVLGAALATAEKQQGADPRPPVERRSAEHPARLQAEDTAAQSTGTALSSQAVAVGEACGEPLRKLVEELGLCRRYYEATFPNRPIDRLIFVGGEARDRGLCQSIAQQMSLAAQVGDPLVRMNRSSEVTLESGIDRRQPQPNWAVAVGLSMGPAQAAVKSAEAA